jgi:phage tail sheath protein FI
MPVEGGLKALLKEQEPTIIVVPDAVKLPVDECYAVYSQVLGHCAKMQSRVAIFDIHNGAGERNEGADDDVITIFREKIGTEFLNYGAAYYPWLNTSIVPNGEITFMNLDSTVDLKTYLLPEEVAAASMLENFTLEQEACIKELKKLKSNEYEKALENDDVKNLKKPKEPNIPEAPEEVILLADNSNQAKFDAYTTEMAKYKKPDGEYFKVQKDYDLKLKTYENALKVYEDNTLMSEFKEGKLKNLSKLLDAYKANKIRNHHQGLVATSPTYVNLLAEITEVVNLLPPSSAMAGLYTMVDNTRGVWKSPANISVKSVIKPSSNITHDNQELLNVDAMSGKSINAIRTFKGVGTMVWGGRTLDGNSLDWRYINVRRTIIMLEQSIKLALRAYVFEPNDSNTWVTVKSMIVNFLTEKWKQGALAGSTPEDAFDVQIGLGNTMTGVDILEGKMLVSIKLAIVRPAEFIVVTFQQQMQKS